VRVERVEVGRCAHVGAMASLMPGSCVADGAVVAPKTLVTRSTPNASCVHGAAAKATDNKPYPLLPEVFANTKNVEPGQLEDPLLGEHIVEGWSPVVSALQLLCMNAMTVLTGLATYPGARCAGWFFDVFGSFGGIISLPFCAFVCDMALLVLVLLVKVLVRPPLKPGSLSVNSWAYVRFWLFQLIFSGAQVVTASLNKSPMCLAWLNAMGVSVGHETVFWVAQSNTFLPHLTEIGNNTFLGGLALFGTMVYHRGRVYFSKVCVKDDCVVAQAAYLAPNSEVGPQSVLGANSVANYSQIREKEVWFGNPAQPIPVPMTPRERTPLWLLCLHFVYVVINISLTKSFDMFTLTYLNWLANLSVVNHWPWSVSMWSWCWGYISVGVAVSLVVLAMKWILLGRIQPGVHDMYSVWAFNRDLVVGLRKWPETALWSVLKGTAVIPFWFRALGTKIGRNVYLEMIGFEESDLSEIGDNVCVLDDSGLDTHYVDNGRWSVNRIKVERNVVIEMNTVVMPGSTIREGAFIAPHACVMPGETVDTGHWVGNPVSPVAA